MHQTRTAATKHPAGSAIGKLTDAVIDGLNRVLEALGPQQQLQPIPVRVRSGRPQNRR